jgi:hypothetical protein
VPTLASSQTCPSCGAPLAWRSAAPYTVCSHCQSLLVRRDADVESIGRVAQVPDDFSPFQLGTVGTFERHRFALVGRLRKTWDEGSWNEWCAAFDDGRFGWLAEAQGDLVMTFAQGPAGVAPAGVADLATGRSWTIGGQDYLVTDVKQVACTGAEGELARGGLDTGAMTSIDLRGPQLLFATWELAGDRAQLCAGRFVEFDECRFTQLRALDGWGTAAGASA